MRIVVDAMGGDKGPAEVVRGVIDAARRSNSSYSLAGDPALLEAEVAKAGSLSDRIEVVPATEVIEMGEQPTTAFRRKPNASVVVAARMVKEKKADAIVTIGNTGAAMAVSLLTLGRIKGIDRPAIATPLPSLAGPVVMLDAGATVDCDPNNLYEFAIMGSVYSQAVIGVKKPRVGLISNGEEAAKGNDLVKRTHALFKESACKGSFDFVGNIEGRDIFRGNVDVAVCDGFVGNVILKTGESVAEMVLKLIKEELSRHFWMKPFVVPLMPSLKRLRRRIDYAEYGGAPMLGINGICIIGHGRSDAYAIMNACRAAERASENNIIELIRERVSDSSLAPPL